MAKYIRRELVEAVYRLHAENKSAYLIGKTLGIDPGTARRYIRGGESYEEAVGDRRDETELDRLIRLQKEDDERTIISFDKNAKASLEAMQGEVEREPNVHPAAPYLIEWHDPTAEDALLRIERPRYLEEIAEQEDLHGLTILTKVIPQEMHGDLRGWRRGCKCRECRDAWNMYSAERKRVQADEKLGTDRKRTGVRRHGKVSTFDVLGCRCDPCVGAKREANRRAREKRQQRRAG